ncbi:MAG: tetratricopeptide repeat protein [Blautia faecis]
MNCMNCGAFLADKDLDYCPHCGCNVLIQKKVEYLSKLYYNQGLEKASIRDLSGAVNCLKQSLTFNKRNIQARNLLGLVYFEMGEVVAALSEWVISKNLQPTRNIANEYINRLQANSNKLDAINETIRKYNNALALCREGHEDMAAIQLRKILNQNTKLIKGYHLLALIYMKNHDWGKARRTLKKAARIDKTNTTTLRFLREVDERTGVTTRLEKQKKGLFGAKGKTEGSDEISRSTVATAGSLQGKFQNFTVCDTYGGCGSRCGCILVSGSSGYQAGDLQRSQSTDCKVQRVSGQPGCGAFQSPG